MEQETLKKLQAAELDILSAVADFCRENEIKYSLYAGTALGAVRHGGFIPWDDDIDICMERGDYERFLALWKEKSVPGYYLQDTGEDSASSLNHSKVRKDHTVLASKKEFAQPGHHGIWVDIFPLDKVPVRRGAKLYMYLVGSIRLVYTRDHPLLGKGKALEFATKCMLLLPRSAKQRIKKWSDRKVKRYQNTREAFQLISLSAAENLRRYFPGDMLAEVEDILFDGRSFAVSAQRDAMLRACYGNYMELPPEAERICKHTPEILVFDDRQEEAVCRD